MCSIYSIKCGGAGAGAGEGTGAGAGAVCSVQCAVCKFGLFLFRCIFVHWQKFREPLTEELVKMLNDGYKLLRPYWDEFSLL